MSAILEKLLKNNREHGLFDKGDRVVIAVSGGPDSVTLLFLLNQLRKGLSLSLHVAHLDHMLRKDSYKDLEYVRALAERLNIPFSADRSDIKRLAAKGSLEEAARDRRIDFLVKLAKRIHADKVALGHNLDDQAETVLMRLIRGTGLSGLAGISPKRTIKGMVFVRPLIGIRRREIENFLKKKKIKARIDDSNLQDVFFRNRIRHELIPLLEKKYNKNIKEVLAGAAESISYDYDYLAQISDRMAPRGACQVLSVKELLRLHTSICRILLRKAIENTQGSTRRISLRNIKEIEDLIRNRPANSIVDLPKGISVIKKKNNTLFFYRQNSQ